jgi:glyoxylase-like metal-dependent hydrolase (beta-lactamase superfamily II)
VKRIADVKMRLDPQWTLTFPPFELRAQDVLVSGDDNQILRQLGIAGRILYTPGHCVDHLSIVLDSGEVFCGDAAASFPLWAGIKYCAVFMTDMEESYRSWQKLLDAGGKVIYPAHGRPFSADKLRQHLGQIPTRKLVKFF